MADTKLVVGLVALTTILACAVRVSGNECTELLVDERPEKDMHRNTTFKRIEKISRSAYTIKAFIMFFIQKSSVKIQIYRDLEKDSRYDRLKEWEVPAPDAEASIIQSNGYKQIYNLPAPYEVKSSDSIAVFSEKTIPLNHIHTKDEAKFSVLLKEKVKGTANTWVFDALPMPYMYQVCPCMEVDCRDLSPQNESIASKVLEKQIIVKMLKGDPGNQGPQGPQGERGPPGKDSPKLGAATGAEESALLTSETMIGMMLWLGVLTLLMMVVLAVLMVICVDNRRSMREKTRPYSRSLSESTQNIKDPNGDWSEAGWHGDNNAI